MSNEESSVRVAVRIRPQTPAEIVERCSICARAGGPAGEGGVALGTERGFTFDYAFEPSSSQEVIYDTCVKRLVEATLDGYNATVLAYGQTGSGKTYTMGSGWEGDGDGDEDRRGIIPRAIRDLFAGADARADAARSQGQLPPEFSVHAQFIELYNEDIVDLLDPAKDVYAKGTLRITEDGCGGVRIVGASSRPVRGAKEALSVLRAGALARTTAATNMNSSSSRSHAVFTLMMRQRRLATETDVEKEDGEQPEQYEILTAKFHFVDLAGSERLKRTGATGERAREGISINCGLLALGNVISALGDKTKKVLHVPYRDSKLTRLLQDSLGGNSNTVMIACVSPSDRDFMETLNTLKYANRARNIKNRCVVNQDLTSRTINQLRTEIARLQLELAEYKQGKRVVSENGEEGWSDVVQENAILTGEVESLRRRVKAMQGTIEQLSTKNSELIAEKALGAWAPKDGSGDTSECSLTTLVQGYVREIEELRAQLLEANALYEASRKREQVANRARHDSSIHDTASVIDDAKKELYKEKELLARSMGELAFARKLNMSDSVTSAVEGDGDSPSVIGERERAEGESADDSDLEDVVDDEEDDDAENKEHLALSEELAALSGDIDTKQRLIEELELSQKRLQALRSHYEQRLDTLHHQIKATQDERDKVLASYATQSSTPSDKLKRVRDEYERRLTGMSRELKRLQNAQREHARLQRSQHVTNSQINTLRAELSNMKRDKVKLVQRMREESKRHAQAEAVKAKEVAQLRKESRKNANLIKTLEAERKLKEQVLRRKQEEVSLLRRGHRDKLSNRAAGRIHGRKPRDEYRIAWSRVERWLSRAAATRGALGELEGTLDRTLALRELARGAGDTDSHRAHLDYLNQTIADTQQQIMQLEAQTDDNELPNVLNEIVTLETARYALERLATAALQHAHEAARHADMVQHYRAQVKQLEESKSRLEGTSWWSPASLSALLAHVSSGTSTRCVSPVDNGVSGVSGVNGESRDRGCPEGVRSDSAPSSPATSPTDSHSPFQRNNVRRGSVRLRDLGVMGGCDVMSQSLVDTPPAPPAPLSRVPSAPGSLRGLVPVGALTSPLTSRRPIDFRTYTRQHSNIPKPASLETCGADRGTPPASPGVRRRGEEDVFHRLTGAATTDQAPPTGVVREFPLKRVSNGGSGNNVWLQCTHVAEGHAGAVLSLYASSNTIYSGGVDRTVRAWDMVGGGESWRGWGGGPVSHVAGGGGAVLGAAGAHVRVFDTRTRGLVNTLWSSGVTGPTSRGAVGAVGEVAVTALTADPHRPHVYTAAGDKIRLWDLRMMECITKIWSGHAAAVMCLALGKTSEGDLLCTGSKDHYVRTLELKNSGGWEANNRRLLEPPHYDGVQALALCGDTLYSASRDTSIKKWSLKNNTLTHGVMNGHKGWVTGLCVVDGYLVSAGREGAVRVWAGPGAGGVVSVAPPAALPDAVHALAPHPHHSHTFYTGGNGGDVRVWRLMRSE